MNSTTDPQDLLDYCATGSEVAFRRLVESHAPMVHGVAVRMLRSAPLAEEVTQSVFIILARKARSIPPSHLPGWLHNAASHECRNALRKETRRREITQRYTEAMNKKPSSAPEPWDEITPHLDEAVGRLSQEDRQMMVLRYFEQRNFHEIAATMGLSEAACKKRAQRALERLGAALRKQGVATSGPALGTVIATFALLPPSTSAASISSVAVGSAGSLASSAPSLFKLILSMTTKQVTTVAAVPAFNLLTALPPILALSVGFIWTTSQSRATASLESKTTLYRQSLETASRIQKSADGEPAKHVVALLANGKIDWKSFSGSMDMEDTFRVIAMQKRLTAMSSAELLAELDEIGKLDTVNQKKIQGLVLAVLTRTDPKAVIDWCPDEPGKGDYWVSQMDAFGNWCQSSPDEAVK